MSLVLTQHQVDFFKVFGYLKLPGLFAKEIADIQQSFAAVFKQHSQDIVDWTHPTHENRNRQFISPFLEKDPLLNTLIEDSRTQSILSKIIGEDYLYRSSDGSIFNCGTLFHRDSYGANLQYLNIKMGLYLDEVDEQSGALRVIPGSHHSGDKYCRSLNRNLIETPTAFDRPINELPVSILASKPGDLLLWDYRIIHGACYRGNSRRMIAIEFSEPYEK